MIKIKFKMKEFFSLRARNAGTIPSSLPIGLFTVLAFSACATHLTIDIDSLWDPDHKSSTSYFIQPGDTNINEQDLHFREYARHVQRVLNQRGFKSTANRKEAGQVVYL